MQSRGPSATRTMAGGRDNGPLVAKGLSLSDHGPTTSGRRGAHCEPVPKLLADGRAHISTRPPGLTKLIVPLMISSTPACELQLT